MNNFHMKISRFTVVLIPMLAVCAAVPANVGIKSRRFARKCASFVQKI